MAEGAALRRYGDVPDKVKEKIKGHSAAADNVGVFFGEDVFVAVGSILLITTFVDTTYHLHLEPLQLAIWAIPTAICRPPDPRVPAAAPGPQLDKEYPRDRSCTRPSTVNAGGNAMINVEAVYWLIGILFVAWAFLIGRDTNHPSAGAAPPSGACWACASSTAPGSRPARRRAGSWASPSWSWWCWPVPPACWATASAAPPARPNARGLRRSFGNKLFIPALTLPRGHRDPGAPAGACAGDRRQARRWIRRTPRSWRWASARSPPSSSPC